MFICIFVLRSFTCFCVWATNDGSWGAGMESGLPTCKAHSLLNYHCRPKSGDEIKYRDESVVTH